MCEVLDRVENRGISQGEETAFSLVRYLLSNNRIDDLKKATEDHSYRKKLMKELFPKKRLMVWSIYSKTHNNQNCN